MPQTLQKEVEFNPILSDLPREGWKYSLHAHKNKHGIHYDLLLAPPNQIIAYSWATKTLPFRGRSTKAFRTKDRLREDMLYEGEFITRSGMSKKKLLVYGDSRIKSIDDRGLTFETRDGVFKITNVKGKRYNIELSE